MPGKDSGFEFSVFLLDSTVHIVESGRIFGNSDVEVRTGPLKKALNLTTSPKNALNFNWP